MTTDYNKSEKRYTRIMGMWLYAIMFFFAVLLVQLSGYYLNHVDNTRYQCSNLALMISSDVSYNSRPSLSRFFDVEENKLNNPALSDIRLVHWTVFAERQVTAEEIKHKHNVFKNIFEVDHFCSIPDAVSPASPVSKYQLKITSLFLPTAGKFLWASLTSLLISGLPVLFMFRISSERNKDKNRLLRFFSLVSQREHGENNNTLEEAESIQAILEEEGQRIIQFIDDTKELNERIDPDYINRLEKNFIDLEERNAHLAIRNKELNRQTTLKSSFFANLSHDFRTPLYTIDGYSRLLLETELQRNQLSHVNAIQTANANLLELVSNFLSLSRLEAGKIELEYSDLDLRKLLEEIALGLSFLTIEHRNHFIIDVSETLPDFIETDAIKLRQILANLISNAVKYTYDGVVYVRISARRIGDDTLAISISVVDTGKGIPEKDLNTIFDPYTRLNRDKTLIHGTGLGLGICKELCEIIGAKLSVTSEENIGSNFTIDMTTKLRSHHNDQKYAFVNLGYHLHIFNCINKIDDYIDEWLSPLDITIQNHSKNDLAEFTQDHVLGSNERILVILDYDDIEDLHKWAAKLQKFADNVIICAPLDLLSTAQIRLLDRFILLPTNLSNFDLSKSISEHATPENRPSSLVSDKPLSPYVLLLAEDNDLNRKIIEERLNSFGAQVISCPDGSAALELYKARKYSAILMDAHMPKISGIELTEIIRRDFSDNETPIIGITASTSSVEYQHFIRSGMTDCLIKPLQDKQLIESIVRFSRTDIQSENPARAESESSHTADQLTENTIQGRIDLLSKDSIKKHIQALKIIMDSNHPNTADKQNVMFQEIHKLNGTLSMTSFKELQNEVIKIENLINPMLWSIQDEVNDTLAKQLSQAELLIQEILPLLEEKTRLE
ncbi:MAG: response regulator [Gammaproteobacteria bacterium]|nr:response regulator [Gammaproteobacteria bacterium]NNC96557.1 response regulator [Gammaproteobacteria bacterium]NNM12916.1 response regulator [Gammaproteobacteria bacterium]